MATEQQLHDVAVAEIEKTEALYIRDAIKREIPCRNLCVIIVVGIAVGTAKPDLVIRIVDVAGVVGDNMQAN